MAVQIQSRRDTAANWTANDPTLAAGEIGFETDTEKLKIGDGATAWTALGYFTSAEINDLTAAVTWANVPNANITEASVTQHVAAIDHDSCLNFLANEHLDWTGDLGATNIHAGNYTDTQPRTQEEIEDWAGALVANATGTHTGITVTYQDATGDMDLVIDHDAASNFVANEHIDHTGVTLTAGTNMTGGGTIAANRTFNAALTTGTNVTGDHGAAATDQVVNVCYGTGDPPAANTTTEGALFVKYTA